MFLPESCGIRGAALDVPRWSPLFASTWGFLWGESWAWLCAVARNPALPRRASLTWTFSLAAGGGSYYPSHDGSGNTHGTPSTWTPVGSGVGVVFAGAPPCIPITASSWGLGCWHSVCWRPGFRAFSALPVWLGHILPSTVLVSR